MTSPTTTKIFPRFFSNLAHTHLKPVDADHDHRETAVARQPEKKTEFFFKE
jgi:hypothetical protein